MIETLLIAMCVGSAADAATTAYFLKHTRITEANPVLRWVIDRAGIIGMVVYKAATAGAFVACHFYVYPLPWEVVAALALYFFGLAAWNIYLIRKAA